MMRMARWMTGSLAGIALLGSSVAAEARPRDHGRGWSQGGWGGQGWHHRRHRGDGFGVGDAIGVAALIGAVAIVASSMAKDRKARDSAPQDGEPPRTGTDYGDDSRPDADLGDAPDDADFSDIAMPDQDRLTDECARAARDEAEGEGGYAEIRRIDRPAATADGYRIDGELQTRAGPRADTGTPRRFTCTIADGRLSDVHLSRRVAAR